jgi:hypothetical protein
MWFDYQSLMRKARQAHRLRHARMKRAPSVNFLFSSRGEERPGGAVAGPTPAFRSPSVTALQRPPCCTSAVVSLLTLASAHSRRPSLWRLVRATSTNCRLPLPRSLSGRTAACSPAGHCATDLWSPEGRSGDPERSTSNRAAPRSGRHTRRRRRLVCRSYRGREHGGTNRTRNSRCFPVKHTRSWMARSMRAAVASRCEAERLLTARSRRSSGSHSFASRSPAPVR